MRTYKPAVTESFLAAAALATRRFIGFDGNLCGADAKALGVSEFAAASGEYLPVITDGIALVESGGIIAAGNPVASDPTGRAVAAAAFVAAAPVITVDDTKLTVDADSTPVTSTGANGAIISAASGFLTPAAPALSGSVLPQAINGWAIDAASAAGEFIRVKLA